MFQIKPIHQKIFKNARPYLRTRKNLIHTRIALRYAFKLLESEQGDEDIVIPAILLHDVGWNTIPEKLQLTAFGPNLSNLRLTKAHESEGARIAETILTQQGYSSEKIKKIRQIIRGHDTRKKAISIDDRIVKDADKLWRYSRKGVAIDLERFNMQPSSYLDYLEKVIAQWFLTKTAREIAQKEIKKRKTEYRISSICQ